MTWKDEEPQTKTTWVGGVAPAYYKIEIPALGVTIMPFDIIDALKLNFNLGCVVKYVLRAGRKGPALDDLKKARNCLDREIAWQEAEKVVTWEPATKVTVATTAFASKR